MIGSKWLAPAAIAAALCSAALCSVAFAQPAEINVDPRIAPAIAAAMQADAQGAKPQDALKPVLALPEHNCGKPGTSKPADCRTFPLGLQFAYAPVRDSALWALADAYLSPTTEEPKPSLGLARAALDTLASRAETASGAAERYAKLGDRKAAQAALKRGGNNDEYTRMYLGFWFNELDAATDAALKIASPTRAFGTKQTGTRAFVREVAIGKMRAASRADLETRLLLAQVDDYWGAENAAISSVIRLVELGAAAQARAEVDKIARFAVERDAAVPAWVAVNSYIQLGEMDRAREIAAPWMTPEKNPPCRPDGGPNIYPFIGKMPGCRLGPHLEEALAKAR